MPYDPKNKLRLIQDVEFSTHFKAETWEDYNRQFFNQLAKKYDATNVLHSFGTKHRMDRAAVARLPIKPGSRILDLCTGSGDIAATHYAKDYRAQADGEALVAGETCLVFELKAINTRVSYDRIRYWISRARELGVQAEFYSVSGKLLKTARFEYDHRIHHDGALQPFMSAMTIADGVEKENITVMTYRDIRPGAVPDSMFNLNLLMQ